MAKYILYTILLLTFTACTIRKPAAMPDKIVFTGGMWVIDELMEINVDSAMKGKEAPYMDFNMDEKRASAFAGCNKMSSGFTINNDTITFEPFAATKMACPDMRYEQAFERLMVPGNYTFKESETALILFYKGNKRISFIRPEKKR